NEGGIVAGTPAQANSDIKTDAVIYALGMDIQVTVTLKDTDGNVVTGQKSALTTTSVTVPNATLKSGTDWTDNEDGTYTAMYTSQNASKNNQASLKLNGWTESRTSEKYAIMGVVEVKDVTVDGHTFAVDTGFPSRGFLNARFQLNVDGPKYYTWRADAGWVSVINGEVRFTGQGTADKVTITGIPTQGQENIVKFSFSLKKWYMVTRVYPRTAEREEVNKRCLDGTGYPAVPLSEFSIHEGYVATQRRQMGALWNEYGRATERMPVPDGVEGDRLGYVSTAEQPPGAPYFKTYTGQTSNGAIIYRSGDVRHLCARDLS
ncbi:hypothetical protein V5L74_003510, partial [Enterobacter hormaechei]